MMFFTILYSIPDIIFTPAVGASLKIVALIFTGVMTIAMLLAIAANHPTGSAHLYKKLLGWTDPLLSFIDPPLSRRLFRKAIEAHLARREFDAGRMLALEADLMEVVNEHLEKQRNFLDAARGWVLEKRPDRARPMFQKAVEQAVQEGVQREAVNIAIEGELYDRAVEIALSSDSPPVRVRAAEAYKMMGRYEDAVNVYLREDDSASAVRTAIEAEMYEMAVEICKNAYDPTVQQMEADVWKASGDKQKAMELYLEFGLKEQAEELAKELGITGDGEPEAESEQQQPEDVKKTSIDIVIPEYKPAPKVARPDLAARKTRMEKKAAEEDISPEQLKEIVKKLQERTSLLGLEDMTKEQILALHDQLSGGHPITSPGAHYVPHGGMRHGGHKRVAQSFDFDEAEKIHQELIGAARYADNAVPPQDAATAPASGEMPGGGGEYRGMPPAQPVQQSHDAPATAGIVPKRTTVRRKSGARKKSVKVKKNPFDFDTFSAPVSSDKASPASPDASRSEPVSGQNVSASGATPASPAHSPEAPASSLLSPIGAPEVKSAFPVPTAPETTTGADNASDRVSDVPDGVAMPVGVGDMSPVVTAGGPGMARATPPVSSGRAGELPAGGPPPKTKKITQLINRLKKKKDARKTAEPVPLEPAPASVPVPVPTPVSAARNLEPMDSPESEQAPEQAVEQDGGVADAGTSGTPDGEKSSAMGTGILYNDIVPETPLPESDTPGDVPSGSELNAVDFDMADGVGSVATPADTSEKNGDAEPEALDVPDVDDESELVEIGTSTPSDRKKAVPPDSQPFPRPIVPNPVREGGEDATHRQEDSINADDESGRGDGA